MAFMMMTTVMIPAMLSASAMTGPFLIASCLLTAMTSLSGIIFSMRAAQCKGRPFKLNWIVDPSGYVYDSRDGSRIEGATATAYWIPYDDTEDFWERKPSDSEYGVLWDASEYEQTNPQLTNVDGLYAWDVPEGWWRVKVEKEGYLMQWSDWMTVPPVQTDVNIGLVSENAPEEEPTTAEEPTSGADEENTAGPETNSGGGIQTETQNLGNTEEVTTHGTMTTAAAEQSTRKKPSVSRRTPPIDKYASKKRALKKRVKITKIKLKRKSGKITWKKVKGVDGYILQYSTLKKFKRKKKEISYSRYTWVFNLNSKKKYYFRVRSYVDIGGRRYYSKWSTVKSRRAK